MKIRLTAIIVNDQEKALRFYTTILGFVKKTEIPMKEDKWITVTSASEPDGVELVLQAATFEPSRVYQKALFDAHLPVTAFYVDNLCAEYDKLLKAGVEFSTPPTATGTTKLAVFNDTCGNHIQLFQKT